MFRFLIVCLYLSVNWRSRLFVIPFIGLILPHYLCLFPIINLLFHRLLLLLFVFRCLKFVRGMAHIVVLSPIAIFVCCKRGVVHIVVVGYFIYH